jgi:hypothetical protein
MTDDEKRESLKTAGLPPHIINEILRTQNESKEYGKEAYRYVKEIMGLEENQIARTLFNAFWLYNGTQKAHGRNGCKGRSEVKPAQLTLLLLVMWVSGFAIGFGLHSLLTGVSYLASS